MEVVMGKSLYSTMFSSPIMGKIMAILDDDDDYWDQVLVMLIAQGYFDPSSSEEEEEESSDFDGISDSSRGDDLCTSITYQENPADMKCRDKPFPAYQAIEFLSGKATATGRHVFTSMMDADDARSTSSSSPATQRLDMESLGKNLEDVNDVNSTSPTPTPVKVPSQYADSASGRTSSMKRLRVSPPIRTPTSSRRRKIDGRSEAMSELVELGRKRTEIAETIMQRQLQARPKVHSIEECMDRLTTVAHLSPDGLFAACEALKDERNRPIFMALSGELLYMWIDRQISMQQLYATQRPAAPFPPATPSLSPAVPLFPAPPTPYTPGSSSFPAAFFPPTVSTFPPGAPSFPSNAPSNPPKGPPFPPN